MKKILFVFVAGLILALAVTNETYAQSSDGIACLTPMRDNYKFREIDAINNSNTIELNMVNTKAMKILRNCIKGPTKNGTRDQIALSPSSFRMVSANI